MSADEINNFVYNPQVSSNMALRRLGHAGVPSKGSIHIIFGPMFSGKTTELLRRIKRYSIAQRKCLLIKYSRDTRYSAENISTHDRVESSATSCSRLEDVRNHALDFGVIGVDEGSFFPDVVPFCEEMANRGKLVIIASLDGTFQRKAFEQEKGSILELIPMSESVVKLSAVCMKCYGDAAFSKRITAETEVEVIGGADKYIAVCRECYFKPISETPVKKGSAAQAQSGNVARGLFESSSDASSESD